MTKGTRKIFNIAAVMCAIATVLFFAHVLHVTGSGAAGYTETEQRILSETAVSLNEDWTVIYEDGSTEEASFPCTLKAPAGQSVTLVHDAVPLAGKAIQFNLRFYGMRVYLDDELLCSTNVSTLAGQFRYAGLQLVKLPDAAGQELKIVLDGSESGRYDIRSIQAGDYGDLRSEIFLSELPTLITLVLMGGICIALIVTSFVMLLQKKSDIRLLNLVLLLLLAIIWGITDSYLPNAFGISMEAAGFLNYASVIALPIPAGAFVFNTVEKNKRAIWLLNAVLICGLALQLGLSCMGVLQLNRTWRYQYVFEFLLVVVGLDSARTLFRSTRSLDILLAYAGIAYLALFSVLTLALHWLGLGFSYRYALLIGILGFVLLLLASVLVKFRKDREHLAELMHEAELEKRMAQLDPMTGIGNRRSYENYIKSVWESADSRTNPVLVIMDINDLKRVNDEYGHAAGDQFIIDAAEAIRRTYEPRALCFRIGGDEFAAVFQDMTESEAYYDEKLRQTLAEHNESAPFRLAIAAGACRLYEEDGVRMSLDKWRTSADFAMYERKREMKLRM